jgi:hypothetical protein
LQSRKGVSRKQRRSVSYKQSRVSRIVSKAAKGAKKEEGKRVARIEFSGRAGPEICVEFCVKR